MRLSLTTNPHSMSITSRRATIITSKTFHVNHLSVNENPANKLPFYTFCTQYYWHLYFCILQSHDFCHLNVYTRVLVAIVSFGIKCNQFFINVIQYNTITTHYFIYRMTHRTNFKERHSIPKHVSFVNDCMVETEGASVCFLAFCYK